MKILFAIAFLVTWFGFLGPYCISAPNTDLVVGWSVLTVLISYITIKEKVKRNEKK